MAVFDPQFESPDPSYLKLSKPTGEAMADTSTGQAIAAFGKGLEGAVNITDTAFQDTIKNELTTRTDAAKESFLDQLNQFQRNQGTTSTTPNDPSVPLPRSDPRKANAMASDEDLTATDDTPTGLKAGLQGIQKIGNAINQSGKTRTTDLDAQLTDILKDVRNRFPGYRDRIDAWGSSIIGYNPGNKLIADKVAQINESASNAAKTQDYWEKKITESGYTGSQEALANLKKTGNIGNAQLWYSGNAEALGAIDLAAKKLGVLDKAHSMAQSAAEDFANKIATEASTANFRNRKLLNDDPTSASSSQIQDKLIELSLHPERRDPDAIRNLGTQMFALEAQNVSETKMALMNAKTQDGTSVYQLLGPTKVKAIIDDNISQLYATMHRQLEDQNLGLVHSTQNTATDMISSKVLQVLDHPSLSNVALTGAALNKLAPNLSPDLQKEVWGGYKDSTGAPSSYAADLLKLSRVQKQQGLAQTGGNVAGPGVGGNVYTFNQAMNEQDKAQALTNAPSSERAAAIKDVLKLKGALLEKDPRAIDAGISFFFDPSNQASLNKWLRDDYYEPGKGVVKGATTTYNEIYGDPQIAKNVWDRAHQGNGLAWDNFKASSDRYAIPALTTMAKTWAVNESQLKNQKMIQGDMPSGTDHHFYYDTDTQQIGITNLKGEPMDLNSTYRANPDVFMVRNANMVLKSLSNIAKTEGSDANAYVFRSLYQAGWKDTPADVETKGKGMSTVSSRILDAIIHSQPLPKPDKEAQ